VTNIPRPSLIFRDLYHQALAKSSQQTTGTYAKDYSESERVTWMYNFEKDLEFKYGVPAAYS